VLAARLDQLLRDLRAVAQDVDDRAQPLRQTGVQAGVREDEAQHLRQAVAGGLEVAFEAQVVAEVELADARGIAAAAQVLEQQGVVQLPALARAQTDDAGHVHADPAAAHAVALGLALGQVECVAEGADDFGQPQPVGGKAGRGQRGQAGVESVHGGNIGRRAPDSRPGPRRGSRVRVPAVLR